MNRRLLAWSAAALLVLCVGHDAAVTPARSWSAQSAVAAIRVYQATVSPRLRGTVYCRFEPTCSIYGRESIAKYGFARGSVRTVWRIMRCNPWTPLGTSDPP